MTLRFSTKAGTLNALRGRVATARIVDLAVLTVASWKSDQPGCVARVTRDLPDAPWIVRSSCQGEDSQTSSGAGAYLSVKDVDGTGLATAVDAVIASYGDPADEDEVLVQPMLRGVLRSGVAFSHDPNTCAPYRVVNWTDGDDTSGVTAGQGGRIWQRAAVAETPVPADLEPVLLLLDELLALFGGVPIDIEFAVTRADGGDDVLWLLQARPLILPRPPEDAGRQAKRLRLIQEKVALGMRPHRALMGERTVYGVMPDWNPAEMIGTRPRPLALSLYRDLITDSIWAYQRHNYGYRNLRSFPLMVHFFGVPYIDVRLSFNSFIPADLERPLAERLVDYYIAKLLAEPALHDKIEFEIVFSCYTLDVRSRLEALDDAGFTTANRETLAASLRRLTNRIIDPEKGLWRADAERLERLKHRREELAASDAGPLERIYWLIEDAKRYGTLPFAGLARAGFIAVQMLRSLVTVGVISRDEHDGFLASISTVSGQLARDHATLDQTRFLARYGHLRPGTYDIMSPRYDESPDLYFDWRRRPAPAPEVRPFSISLNQMRDLSRLLSSEGFEQGPIELFDFLQSSIELREFAKFEFTRNLSDAMALMTAFGAEYGFSAEDLSYANLPVFQELHIAGIEPRDALDRAIDRGRALYQDTLAVSLPPVIADPQDVWSFEWPETEPNFVTQRQVTAKVTDGETREALAGAIVCIPSADPGFDWLFSYPIAGLITAWGGANSHMAIRAGELGLPAVVGAGESSFRRWSSAQRLHIDCAGRVVRVLS